MIDIKRNNENPTGWTAYVRAYKEKYPERAESIDYKALMKDYIGGVPV